MTITEPTDTSEPSDVEAFVDRVFGAVLAAQEVQAAYLGDRLGYYTALAGAPANSVELAERTDTAERYAREWLEHQTVTGYLTVDDATDAPEDRRYRLPAAHAAVLTQPESLDHMLPFARFVAGLGKSLDAITDAFRTGGGVSWAEFGEDPREAQAAANRPMYLHLLGHDYLRSLPEVATALDAGGRVADVGCGGGWSSIGVAEAFPAAHVDGFDIDAPSVALATANAEARGLGDRVTFRHTDGADVADAGRYQLVLALECIHDMPDPVSVLATMRSLRADDGTVIVMDERTGETFTGEPDPIEQLLYGFSITGCLPDGLAHEHSVGTGTVMRPSTFEGYAREAGFDGIEILPIENDFFRFYRLIG